MPWSEITIMSQRLEFVRRVLQRLESMAELCAEFCVSEKTGYKWMAGFRVDGAAGLADRSHAPDHLTRLAMAKDFEATFETLREVLRAHAAGLTVAVDTPERFCLEATPGPATLAAWAGRPRRPTLPVAWVERGRGYVGYHLMGLNGNPALAAHLSAELQARRQGKTCFNFRRPEEAPLAELAAVTAASIAGLRRAGFITE